MNGRPLYLGVIANLVQGSFVAYEFAIFLRQLLMLTIRLDSPTEKLSTASAGCVARLVPNSFNFSSLGL